MESKMRSCLYQLAIFAIMVHKKQSQHFNVLPKWAFIPHTSMGQLSAGWLALANQLRAVGLAGRRPSCRPVPCIFILSKGWQGNRYPGAVLLMVKAEEGQTHYFPSACVVSPNSPLAEASHVAKFKIKGEGDKLCLSVRGIAKLHGNGATWRSEELRC